MNDEFRRLVGKAGTFEILAALDSKPLTYKTLEFEVVGRSSVYTALNAVQKFRLVEHVGDAYRATSHGKKFLRIVKQLDQICPEELNGRRNQRGTRISDRS